jgi:hypothetical protein
MGNARRSASSAGWWSNFQRLVTSDRATDWVPWKLVNFALPNDVCRTRTPGTPSAPCPRQPTFPSLQLNY